MSQMRGLVKCNSLVCKKHLKKEFVFHDVLVSKYGGKFNKLEIDDFNKFLTLFKKEKIYVTRDEKHLFAILQDIFFSENAYLDLKKSFCYSYIYNDLKRIMTNNLIKRFCDFSLDEYTTIPKYKKKYERLYYPSWVEGIKYVQVMRYAVSQALISYLFQTEKYLKVPELYDFLVKVEEMESPESLNIKEFVDAWVGELKHNPWDFKMTRHEKTGRGIDKVGEIK